MSSLNLQRIHGEEDVFVDWDGNQKGLGRTGKGLSAREAAEQRLGDRSQQSQFEGWRPPLSAPGPSAMPPLPCTCAWGRPPGPRAQREQLASNGRPFCASSCRHGQSTPGLSQEAGRLVYVKLLPGPWATCEVAFPSSWPQEVLAHLFCAGGVEGSAQVPPLGRLALHGRASRESARAGLAASLLGRLITCKTTEISPCLFFLSFHFEVNRIDSLEVAKITQKVQP